MKPSELKELIKKRIQAGINRPVFIEASPGVGKTHICGQVAKELNIGFIALHAPLMQPEDYGFPVITADRKDVNFVVCASKFPIEGSDCPDKGILLIDELPQADNAGQKILANLVQEREIHGKRIKPGWSIVLTGNRTVDRAGANRVLSHLGARMTRVPMEVCLEDWTAWAIESGIAPEVISFIRYCPDLLSKFDPQQEINPTPRAWAEGVSKALGVISTGHELSVFTGDVGEGPAAQFLGFVKIYRDLPNPDDIVKNPNGHRVPSDPATRYALCGALSTRANSENFGRMLTYICRFDSPEFVVLFVRDTLKRKPDLANCKEYIDWGVSTGAKLVA